MNTNYRLWW